MTCDKKLLLDLNLEMYRGEFGRDTNALETLSSKWR